MKKATIRRRGARQGVYGVHLADALWQGWAPAARGPAPPKGSTVGAVLFEAHDGLVPGEGHRFRTEVYFDGPTGRVQKNGALEVERVGRPFFVDFEAPVREAPTIAVNRTVESGGVPVTLTEVVNSPAGSRAYLCFDPPEGEYDWPLGKTGLFGRGRLAEAPVYHTRDGALREGCARPGHGRRCTYPSRGWQRPDERCRRVVARSARAPSVSYGTGGWRSPCCLVIPRAAEGGRRGSPARWCSR